MKKTILGLDLGTNSIGWALVEADEKNDPIGIIAMGSRIIPMGAELSKFEQGQAQTKNANRRIARGGRKLNKRYKQRRNKLIYILQQLKMLPSQIKLSSEFNDPLKLDKVSILPIAKKQKQYTAIDLLDLRVKALSEKIELEELGRIIYLFNQLRGYAGGDMASEKDTENDEEQENDEKKRNESYITFAKVVRISEPEIVTFKNRQLKKIHVTVETEDGIIEGETFLEALKEGEALELLVNIRKSKQGTTITFKLPNKTSWRKKMENLEKELDEASLKKGKEVFLSEYFFDILKEDRWAKIRNNVILRSRYLSEFDAVWDEQSKHYPFLNKLDTDTLTSILHFIFPGSKDSQVKFRAEGIDNGLKYVIKKQIIFYQRELKDQSDLISDCRYEKTEKAVAKSHPTFQEFKIWEQINKLTINTKTENGINRKGEIKYTYEDRPIPSRLKEWLYVELQNKKEINFSIVLNKLKKEYDLRENTDFLNGINAKARLRGNETRLMLKKALGELWDILGLQDINRQIELWDILYNGRGNEYDIQSDRTSRILAFIKKHANGLSDIETIAIQISKIKFSRNYSSLSLKAIEKILPLVRTGKYFESNLSEGLRNKIIKLLNEHVSDPFEKAAQQYLEKNIEVLAEGGIMNAYAIILVYDKHTAKAFGKDELINSYYQIKRLKEGELRNPLVEQLISETLIVVKDIWKYFGSKPDEIRLELSRDLKNNAERRANLYKTTRNNQRDNEAIKDELIELGRTLSLTNSKTPGAAKEMFANQYKYPSKTEIDKMKLWKQQNCVSPYTGQPIQLSELFKRERYDVDHIIPQSRYFDDSLANKVICEKAINTDKGNKTAMEYFETGSVIPGVLSKNSYIDHVNKHFHGIKRKNLLATKVPEDPVVRQIKETQYISIRTKEELNKIVGNDHVKTTTGGITDYLRNQWGLTDKFKELLKSRYEKIAPVRAEIEYEQYKNEVTERQKKVDTPFHETILSKEKFIESFNQNFIKKKNNKWIIQDWSKRVDHRHHAIDALVVACTSPAHIKRLNDLNKELQTWLDTNRNSLLPNFEGTPTELLDEILNLTSDERAKIFIQIERFRKIELPWQGFPEDAEKKIQDIIISQKPKDKLLIQKGRDNKLQIKIRGQLHEGTLYGKSQGVETYRIPLSKLSGKNFATEKVIEKVTDSFLKNTLKEHLKAYDNKKDEAFSAEGILALNKELALKHNSKGLLSPHTPVSSVKIFYRDPAKVKKKKGQEDPDEALQKLDRGKAYNNSLFVKTGDNYLFAVIEKEGKRIFDLITLFDAANLLKDEFNKETDSKKLNKEQIFKNYFEEKWKATLLYTLKQGDPVYMPSDYEDMITDAESPLFNDFWNNKAERSKSIYYVVKYSGRQIYFIRHNIADTIIKGIEFGSQNAYEKINGISIKDKCIKLNIDRLGNVKPA